MTKKGKKKRERDILLRRLLLVSKLLLICSLLGWLWLWLLPYSTMNGNL